MRWVVGLLVLTAGWGQVALFERAVSALNAGDYGAAEAGFQEVLKESPQHVGAMQNLGLVYSRTGRLDLAVEEFRKALQVRPGDRALLKNLVAVYLKKGADREALPVFEQLVEVDPGSARDPELLYLVLQHNPEGAASLLAKVPAAPAGLVRCRIESDAGRFDEAATACRIALKAERDYPGAHRELGKALVGAHDAAAQAELRRAIALNPNDSVAVYYLGLALLQDGDAGAAAGQFETAARMDPSFWGSYYYLGKVKLQMQHADQAVPLLLKASDLNPESAEVFYELGRALIAVGRGEEGQRAMARVRELRAAEVERDQRVLRKK